MTNNTLRKFFGKIMISLSILFILIFHFIVTGTSGEIFSRDLFGFIIPTPPLWTTLIPFIGYFLGIIFEMFSLHGLVGISIFIIIFSIGTYLNKQ